MTLGDPSVTAVDIGIGKSRAGDSYGGAATGCPKGVVGSPAPKAE